MTKWTLAAIPSMQGRLAVVTEANSGIGWRTALELARAGAEVILASSTEARGRDAVDRIRLHIPNAKVRAEVLDLASLRSVQTFAARIDMEAKLDLLITKPARDEAAARHLWEMAEWLTGVRMGALADNNPATIRTLSASDG